MSVPPDFLLEGFLREAAAFAGLPPPMTDAVLAAGTAMRDRPELWDKIARARDATFTDPRGGDKPPLADESLGEHARMPALLALLAMLPRARAIWAERNIPADVVALTLTDIPIWMRHERGRTGRWGVPRMGWLGHHLSGKIYRLGRVQFMLGKFPGDVTAYRHRRTGEVKLLLAGGLVFRADGHMDGTNRRHDPAGRWTSSLRVEPGGVTGHAVTTDARAERSPVTLAGADWEEFLRKDDPILDMHIPAEDPLTPEAVKDSCRQAAEFFPRHFPESSYQAVACWAWLLDPTYQRILPPKSNIPGFQKLFHLYPTIEYDDSAFFRVFGEKPADLTKAPRDTGLRRAILDLYAAGGELLGAAGGIWREPVSRP